MKYEAKVSFAGPVTMRKGEVRELERSLALPLVKCGYLAEKRKPKESKRTNNGDNL